MNERPTSCASTRGRAGSPSSENHVVPEEEQFYDVFDSFSLSDGNEEVWNDFDDAVYWKWDCEVIGESHLEEVELSSMGNLQSDRNRGKNPLKVKSKSPAKSTKQEYVGREKDYKSGGKEPGGGGGGGGAVEPTSVLVTDSWRHVREIQERGPAAVPSSAPSDDSSSPDELYVEPAEMASGDQGTSEPFVTTVGPNFTIVKHRKADLGPTLTDTCLTGILSGKDEDLVSSHTLSVPSSQRRFSSQNETQLESNVLRKVASLTLDRATIDKQTSKPKFTPPKLDFQLYEKFEGGMLVNWLGSSLGEELKQVTDWKQILGRLCCHLLSVGVIRQVTDKDTPPNTQFRTDLMYYWAHNESAGPICPPTPGRLSKLSWPPSEPSTPVTSSIRISTDNLSSRKDLDQISISSDMKELAKINQEQKCLIGDLQTQLDKHNHEKERLKTLADIQALNNKMQLEFSVEDKCVQTDESLIEKLDSSRTTFLNPSTVEKYVQTCDTCKNCRLMSTQTSFEDKLSSLNSLDSYKSAMESLNLPNVTDDVKFSSLAMSKSESSIASSNKNLNHNESVVKCPQNTLTQIKEIDRGTEETNSGHEDVTKISNGEISHKVSNGIAEIQIHRAEEAASGRISEAATSLPKSEDLTSQSSCPPPSPGKSPGPPPMPGGTEESQIKKETTDKTKTSPRPPKSPSSEPPPLVPETCLPPPTPPVPEIGLPPPPPPMPEMGPPPPPLPEMGPPPPPMPGMGPPPPPMPGMGPPPPPMPGMGPPPPPMPGMGPPPPPPPPMAGIGFAPALPGSGPLPPPLPGGPPPPPMPGMGPAPPPLPGMGPPPPPPPGVGIATGVPPPPPSSSPVPFPSPPIGGWNAERSTFRKQPLVPPVPMKPLYWTRVVVPFTVDEPDFSTEKICKTALWSELEEASITDLEEFTSLFSRQVVDRKNTKKKVTKPTKAQVLKVLDSKRSQNVGILSTSLHLDFSEIENSVYNFDTSVVSLESLQQIYEVRATEEEVMLIKEQQMLHPDQMLDKPEQFLLELAEIPHFAERIACFMFQAQFTDNITGIESKLNNLKSTCHTLVTSDRLKSVFAIILALGNFMNGGNRQRGQADGFGLEILSKLKDVKSKDNSITLLHYIVKSYIKNCGDKSMSDLLLPVPEPGDVERASTVSFEAVQSQIGQLQNDLNDCIKKVKLVTEAAVSENVETFKNKMDAFVSKAETNLKDETENLDECRQKFVSLLKFYQFHAPGGKLNEVEPKEFFSLWTPFCSDFKDLWKKEEHLRKAKLKETLKKQKEIKRGVQKVKIGGFKSTLLKFEEEITNVKN